MKKLVIISSVACLTIFAMVFVGCNKTILPLQTKMNGEYFLPKKLSPEKIFQDITIENGVVSFKTQETYSNFEQAINNDNYKIFEDKLYSLGHKSYLKITTEVLDLIEKVDNDKNENDQVALRHLEENEILFTKIEDGFMKKNHNLASSIACNSQLIYKVENNFFYATDEAVFKVDLKHFDDLKNLSLSGQLSNNISKESKVLIPIESQTKKTRATGIAPTSWTLSNDCQNGGALKLRVIGGAFWSAGNNGPNAIIVAAMVRVINQRRGRDFGAWGAWHETLNQDTKAKVNVNDVFSFNGTVTHSVIAHNNLDVIMFAFGINNWPIGLPLTANNIWPSNANNATIITAGTANDNRTQFTVNWNGWGNNTFGCNGKTIFYNNF